MSQFADLAASARAHETGAAPWARLRELLDSRPDVTAVCDRLRVAMWTGTLAPGERLPDERSLTTSLGVSRETVRAALRHLIDAGSVRTRRGRGGGTFAHAGGPTTDRTRVLRRVLDPLWADLEPLLDLRTLLRSLVASTAARRRTEDQVGELVAAVGVLRTTATAEEFRVAEARLERVLGAAAHNDYLVGLERDLRVVTNLGFSRDPWQPELVPVASTHATAMVDAITRGEPARSGGAAAAYSQARYVGPWRAVRSLSLGEPPARIVVPQRPTGIAGR